MTASISSKRRAGGGRAGRIAQRTAAKRAFAPAPPGQTSGYYKPLKDVEIVKILDAAYRILEEIGFADVPEIVKKRVLGGGCFLSSRGRLAMPRSLVEDIVAGACRRFIFHGRDPVRTIEVGGDRVYFGTGGAAVQTLDLDTGQYRAATLADLQDFTRLVDRLENISWFTRCCIATDISDPFELDLRTALALMQGTQKPVGTSFTYARHVSPIVEMFDAVAGGEGRFAEAPFCKAHISPVISPLRFGEDAVEVMLACLEHNMPINAIIAAQSGATAPAPLAGMLAQTTAEALAALVLVNLFKPGHPMIFSNWPFVIDLRTGAFAGSGGEISLLNSAAAQIGNFLGLPTGVAASMADAKAVDAQMGSEKALSSIACGLAGANMVYESAGMMGALLGASFEAFVLDNEMLGNVHRCLRGIEVDDESIGFNAIEEAVLGDGHFLGHPQTLAAMERDYLYPALADRTSPTVWQESGALEARSTARTKARQILETHHPNYAPMIDASTLLQRFALGSR